MEININKNHNTNFGMALYMPNKLKIQKKIGYYAATEAEKARGTLTDLAKDVDIYLKPKRSKLKCYSGYDYFEYKVTDIGKNKFDRMIKKSGCQLTKNIYISPNDGPLSSRLIDALRVTVRDMKTLLNKS